MGGVANPGQIHRHDDREVHGSPQVDEDRTQDRPGMMADLHPGVYDEQKNVDREQQDQGFSEAKDELREDFGA